MTTGWSKHPSTLASTHRVVALGPMPPEKCAYALARYSRSPDAIEDSLRWVHAHSAERFWEKFYFDYGHASIADLGHVALCFEGLSELAAIHVIDEQLWDGQARSSRYQDFSTAGYVLPAELAGRPAEDLYRATVEALLAAYQAVFQRVAASLPERHPRPPAVPADQYQRNLQARAFDVARYLLPLASRTNVGQVVNIRTLERQIGRLLASSTRELQAIGRDVVEACCQPPLGLWDELTGRPSTAEPIAPTLARRLAPSAYPAEAYAALRTLHDERFGGRAPEPVEPVDLVEPANPVDELVATLLYRVSHLPFRQILADVREWSEGERLEVVDLALRARPPRDDLLPEFRTGYAFVFDVLMDIGGWRDLHRHRRCQQVRQEFTGQHGYETPELLEEIGCRSHYDPAMHAAAAAWEQLAAESPEGAAYLLPFGFRVRCLFKMDFAEAEYIARVRSGVKGHFSYRRIAWLMKQKIEQHHPALGSRIAATPPWVEDPLTR